MSPPLFCSQLAHSTEVCSSRVPPLRVPSIATSVNWLVRPIAQRHRSPSGSPLLFGRRLVRAVNRSDAEGPRVGLGVGVGRDGGAGGARALALAFAFDAPLVLVAASAARERHVVEALASRARRTRLRVLRLAGRRAARALLHVPVDAAAAPARAVAQRGGHRQDVARVARLEQQPSQADRRRTRRLVRQQVRAHAAAARSGRPADRRRQRVRRFQQHRERLTSASVTRGARALTDETKRRLYVVLRDERPAAAGISKCRRIAARECSSSGQKE